MNYLRDQLGKPLRGRPGTGDVDCSGLVRRTRRPVTVCFRPPRSWQRAGTAAIAADRPGDLYVGHVQMHLDVIDGKPIMIEATNPREPIRH